jgi:hypothetical protein
MAKVLCVLYDDPVGGYPRTYDRDEIPSGRCRPSAAGCLGIFAIWICKPRRELDVT